MGVSTLRKVNFDNDCFWHQHSGCRLARLPKTRLEYWLPKLEQTAKRDMASRGALNAIGWKVLVVWECETVNSCIIGREDRGLLARRADERRVTPFLFLDVPHDDLSTDGNNWARAAPSRAGGPALGLASSSERACWILVVSQRAVAGFRVPAPRRGAKAPRFPTDAAPTNSSPRFLFLAETFAIGTSRAGLAAGSSSEMARWQGQVRPAKSRRAGLSPALGETTNTAVANQTTGALPSAPCARGNCSLLVSTVANLPSGL